MLRFLIMSGLLAYAVPALADSGGTFALYMQRNVYARQTPACNGSLFLCPQQPSQSYLQLGSARRPQAGDGLQLRFGRSNVHAAGPAPIQKPAPITDTLNTAAPYVNTGLFLYALSQFLGK
jgi:hypothetical protein